MYIYTKLIRSKAIRNETAHVVFVIFSQILRLILRSFLRLECFGYNNNNRDFVNLQYLEQRFRKGIIPLKFSSYTSFFTPHVKIAVERNG